MTTVGKSIAYLILGIALTIAAIGKALWWLAKALAKGLWLAVKHSGLTIYWIFRILFWELPAGFGKLLAWCAKAFAAGFAQPFAKRELEQKARWQEEDDTRDLRRFIAQNYGCTDRHSGRAYHQYKERLEKQFKERYGRNPSYYIHHPLNGY